MRRAYSRITGAILLLLLLIGSAASPAYAQFEETSFEKVTNDADDRREFQQRFADIKWTGQGMYRQTEIDRMQTNRLRARLQARFGDPTQTLEDLINGENFRPAEAIQFEYWFTVDDSIPFMVLDVDGPFGRGLVYAGASRYIDLMPQIKRSFTEELMSVEMAQFQDYFYSPEREQWFDVRYDNGKFVSKKIESPDGMTIRFNYGQDR
ncbi:MAG: hypothetical protein R3211_03240 [Balneolaceae bacterium]|nr:hypothetical protein [Balneolaceae bacterium]